ncbi:MAG: TIM barrel protein [Spirosomataceae bacterium]|jgi:sugar phosphate isomerase/epimerase
MNRRDFTKQAGIMSAATLLPFAKFSEPMKPKFKFGYQLFSVNKDMNEDPLGTLTALKAMGYQDFEIYGFDDRKLTFYGLPAAEFRQMLNDSNLTASSGHFLFHQLFDKSEDEMNRFVDQCIKGADALSLSYITWPWLAPEQRSIENFKILSGKLNKIGERVNAANLGFAYHNHGFEFEPQNGELGYDIILKETDPKFVKLQMDMYWVMHEGKTTPKELIAKQPGRFVMWHIKDMDKTSRDYTELGNGSIDYHDILPNPKKSGLEYYYIEQGGNFATNPMQSAADSASFFKKELAKYL